MIKDIIPFIESHYSVYADREHRAQYDKTWAAMLEKLEEAVNE